MNELINGGPNSGSQDPYVKPLTRWEDLKQSVKAIIKIATTLNDQGIDLYFLNRKGATGVTDWKDVKDLFVAKPKGHTPLTEVISKIISKKTDAEKRVLIVISTDGEPYDINGYDNPQRFKQLLKNRDSDKFFISIIACSDDKQDIHYLEDLDKYIKHLDVTDDYNTERLEVLRKGRTHRFTRGDYVTKALMGSIIPNWHKIDGKADKNKCILS